MGIFDFGKQVETIVMGESSDGMYRMVGIEGSAQTKDVQDDAWPIVAAVPQSSYAYVDDSAAAPSPSDSPSSYDYPLTSDSNGGVPICPNG